MKKRLQAVLTEMLHNPASRTGFQLDFQAGASPMGPRAFLSITPGNCIFREIPLGTPLDPEKEREREQIQEFSLPQDSLLLLLQGLVDTAVWDLERCPDSPVPDDSRLKLTIKNREVPIFEQSTWYTCKYKDERTRALLNLIAALAPRGFPYLEQ